MKTYEEKYKKALEWMREVYPTLQGAAKEDAEYYFPELCESEDEKIRQLLLRFVKYDMSDNYSDDFTPADCVAWLEKQGEKSSLNTNQEYLKGIKRVQEYQDLSDWEKKFDDIASMYAHNKNQEGYNESWYVKERAAAMLYHAKKELDKQGEQKSAEWSKEDEDILNTIINHFKVDIECTDEDDTVRWLKSLKDRVQPKQEWSEEDEEMIDSIIGNIKYLYSIGSCDNATVDMKVNWLKSLRPQNTWKPSDEQMVVLNDIIINGHLSNANERILKGLQEQLKKLKE